MPRLQQVGNLAGFLGNGVAHRNRRPETLPLQRRFAFSDATQQGVTSGPPMEKGQLCASLPIFRERPRRRGHPTRRLVDRLFLSFSERRNASSGGEEGPSVLIMIILVVAGMVEENEDKVLIKQRIERGRATDAELGITRKPAWWRKTAVDYMSPEERLKNMTKSFGGRKKAAHRHSRDIPLEDLASPSSPPPYSSTPTSPTVGVSSGTAPVVGLRDRSYTWTASCY